MESLGHSPQPAVPSGGPLEASVELQTVQVVQQPRPQPPAHAPEDEAEEPLSPGKSVGVRQKWQEYLNLRKAHWPKVPDVFIKYENLAYEVQIPKKVRHVQTVFSAVRNFARRVIGRQASTKTLKVLSPSTGSFAPGTMTLIMSEPGGGTSTFLKLLAGQVPQPKAMSGKVLYNGHTLEELDKIENALKVPKAVAYVDQEDNHMSLLTVRETLEFAKNLMCIEPHYIAHPELIQHQERKVDQILELLGLNECAETIVGNDFVRGISGGQKKRVSIAEMLMGEARVFLFDEITTGLDSAVAFDILSSILQSVETLNTTVIAGLLQPTPEVYGLFHDVILMRGGKIMYHGPRTEVPHFMAAIGVPIPDHMDEADFLTEFLSNSQYVAEKYGRPPVDPSLPLQQQQQQQQGAAVEEHKSQEPQQPQQPQQPEQPEQPEQHPVPDITTPRLQEVFRQTPAAAALQRQTEEYVPRSVDMTKLGDFARLQYGQHYGRSFKYQTKLSMYREFTVMRRDRTSVIPRVLQAIIMSLVLGTLFWDLGVDKYYTRIGLIMYASLGIGFGSMVELPSILEQKRVLLKHNAAKMMRVPSFVLSVDASHMVVGFLEVLMLGVVLFWMTNMVPDTGRFLTWIAVLIALSFAFGGFFRLIAAAAKDQPMAQLLATPFIMTFVIFSGFLVSRDNIPGPFIVFYWLSPVSWMLRALALNEFKDPERYGRLVELSDGSQVPLGDYYLDTMEFPTDQVFIWLGFGYLVVWWLASSLASTYALSKARRHQPGTQRLSVHQEDPDDELEFFQLKGRDAGQEKKPSTIASVEFTPANLVWKDIRYQVQVGKKRGKKQYKTLLRGVSGHCTPGTLTAMLGASGAGKSTLMDVIAGRKTGGIIEGEILVNGVPKDPKTFGRIAGYVEQQDIHNPTATVREALLFAAKLRLPRSVPEEQRLAMVDEVLDLLELTEIQHRVIGGQMIVGLAPGERKRVTIGVELVANPSILFLDEPTSGIDSRAAMEVVRVLKRIAATGRSVLCTVHQPSTELFSHFDRLLLLSPGGRQVYFGSNEHIRSYFEAIPGTEPCGRQNPATWILNVVGDADENPEEVSKRFSQLYQDSDLIQFNREEIDRLAQESAAGDKQPAAASPSSVRKPSGDVGKEEETGELDQAYATSIWTQIMLLNLRSGRGLMRSVRFSLSRLVLLLIAGILFGIIYYDVATSTDFAGVNSVVGLVFISGTFGALIFCSTSLPYLFEQRAVFYRESSSNTYSKWSYALNLFFPDWPYIITGSILYTLPLYFLAGFKREFAAYAMYWLTTVMMMFTFVYLGQVLSSTLPNLVAANAIQGLTFNFVNLFGGLFIYFSDIPDYWVWFYYLNPVAKGIQCFLLTQFDCEGPDCPVMEVPERGQMTVSDFVSMNFNYDYDDYWSLIGYIAITASALYVIAILALRFVNHLKR